MTIIGLDLSLVASGYVKLVDGKIEQQLLIKSKSQGDRPIDELERILGIVEQIPAKNYPLGTKKDSFSGIDLAVIEGMAFMARNTQALVQLAALNYFIRRKFYEKAIPFLLVAPSSLKKFVTGKGNGDKNLMLLEVYKRYGVTFDNDNLADAFGLALIGEVLLSPQEKIPKHQQEVINLLKKQLLS